MMASIEGLPTEIRLKIYRDLLARPSVIVEYVPDMFNSGFKARSNSSLSPQILRTSKNINSECLPIFYGCHRFNCASSILGIENLKTQIGARNFGYIKHIIVDWIDITSISCAMKNIVTNVLYQNLETLTIQKYLRLDLDRLESLLDVDLVELRKKCQSARNILSQHPRLHILGQISTKRLKTPRHPEAFFSIKWRLLLSSSALRANVSNDIGFLPRRYRYW